MKQGDVVTYRCLAGIDTKAVVRFVRPDGTVDIGCEVGSKTLHELTRIEVVKDLQAGTCRENLGHPEAADQAHSAIAKARRPNRKVRAPEHADLFG